MAKFKQEVLDKISEDADLYAAVSKEMDIKPASLAISLYRNGRALNRKAVVEVVANYLQDDPENLLEQENKGNNVFRQNPIRKTTH